MGGGWSFCAMLNPRTLFERSENIFRVFFVCFVAKINLQIIADI